MKNLYKWLVARWIVVVMGAISLLVVAIFLLLQWAFLITSRGE